MSANNVMNQSSSSEIQNVCCGLVKIVMEKTWMPPSKTPIPLLSVHVNASVVQAVAQVEVTQVYVNQEEQPIEAVYYFPINPDGAVTHFQAELEGRVIKVAHDNTFQLIQRTIINTETMQSRSFSWSFKTLIFCCS